MVQCGGTTRLLDEPVHALCIACNLERKNLQSDGALQLAVVRKIYLPHSTGPELSADFIATQFCSWRDSHLRLFVLWKAYALYQTIEARIRTYRVKAPLNLHAHEIEIVVFVRLFKVLKR